MLGLKHFTSDDFYSKTKLFWVVLLFLVSLKTHRSNIGQGDEPYYIMVAESLYLDRDVEVFNNHFSPYLLTIRKPYHHTYIRQGKEWPFSPVGLSILGIPVYAVAHAVIKVGMRLGKFKKQDRRWIFMKNTFSFSMMITASFFSVFLFSIFRKLTGRHRLSWFLALLFSLSPPLLSYGLLFFTDLPSAFIIIYLYWGLLSKDRFGFWKAFWIGYMLLIHPRNATIAGAFLVLFLFQEWQLRAAKREDFRWPRVLGFCGLTIFLWLGAFVYNYALWGNISLAGYYQYIGYKSFDWAYLPTAVPALFFDRAFGLFGVNILFIFGIGGFIVLWQEQRKNAIFTLLLILSYLVCVSGFLYWWGGWAPGPRYLMPIVPILVFLSVLMINRLWDFKQWRVIFKSLFGMTFIFSALLWQKPMMLWNYDHDANRFFIQWFGNLGRVFQDLLPNFFSKSPSPQLVTLFYLTIFLLINILALNDIRRAGRLTNKPE